MQILLLPFLFLFTAIWAFASTFPIFYAAVLLLKKIPVKFQADNLQIQQIYFAL